MGRAGGLTLRGPRTHTRHGHAPRPASWRSRCRQDVWRGSCTHMHYTPALFPFTLFISPFTHTHTHTHMSADARTHAHAATTATICLPDLGARSQGSEEVLDHGHGEVGEAAGGWEDGRSNDREEVDMGGAAGETLGCCKSVLMESAKGTHPGHPHCLPMHARTSAIAGP